MIIQVFAREVIEKVGELEQEKRKTEKAFHDFLPSCIVRDIKRKKVEDLITITCPKQIPFIKVSAEEFACVTIFYGDIIDFNILTRDCTPSEVGLNIRNYLLYLSFYSAH